MLDFGIKIIIPWKEPDSEVLPTIKLIGISHCKLFCGGHLNGERGTDTKHVGPHR